MDRLWTIVMRVGLTIMWVLTAVTVVVSVWHRHVVYAALIGAAAWWLTKTLKNAD